MLSISEQEERKTGKELYSYQKGAIQKIFKCFACFSTGSAPI